MSAHWTSLRQSFIRYVGSESARCAMLRAQLKHAPLAGFVSPEHAVEFLATRHSPSSCETKDALVAVLIELAQSGEERELAHALLWLGLWPGLERSFRRRLRWFRSDAEALSAFGTRFHAQIARFNCDRVTRVIATLVMNTERDMLDELVANWKCSARLVDLDPDSSTMNLNPERDAECTAAAKSDLLRAMELLKLSADCELVWTVTALGVPLQEAAELRGAGVEATKKRVQRALGRIRENLAEPMSR